MTGVDTSSARVSGASMAGVLRLDPRGDLQGRGTLQALPGNQRWCQTGGKQGQPARLDGEDLRPLGDGSRVCA
jgi:hypothetical protein